MPSPTIAAGYPKALLDFVVDDADYVPASVAAGRCEHLLCVSMAWRHSPRVHRATCRLKWSFRDS